jgi:uDENN domain
MVIALADYFFIAGLEGHEPAIASVTANFRALLSGDVPTVQEEPILEEPSPSGDKINEAPTAMEETASVSCVAYSGSTSDRPTTPSSSTATIRPFSQLAESDDSSSIFDDVMSKFTSEREEFLLTLTPPSIPTPPLSATPPNRLSVQSVSVQGDEHKDSLAELHIVATERQSLSSLRQRSSLRNKLADLSRRTSHASRSNSVLRRRNTNGTDSLGLVFHSFSNPKLIQASRKGSHRYSGAYNAVIPTPEPLLLPPGTHPLKRKLAPRLLGIWPTSNMIEDIKERGAAPDYLPMFAFPNDIQVCLSDTRPKSTWHAFVSTPVPFDFPFAQIQANDRQ